MKAFETVFIGCKYHIKAQVALVTSCSLYTTSLAAVDFINVLHANFSFNNNFSRHIKQFGLKCQTLCLIWTYMAGLYVRICVRNMRTYTCASVYVMYAFTHLITGKTKNTLDHSLLLRSEWKDEEILISETFHDFSNYWKLF